MYVHLNSHFFRSTRGIQSGQDPFDKSSLLMTFLTNSEVTWILCNFGLVLERKLVKEILKSSRLEVLEKFFANSFGLSETKDHLRAIKWGNAADVLILRTLLASHKNLFASITSVSEFQFRCRKFHHRYTFLEKKKVYYWCKYEYVQTLTYCFYKCSKLRLVSWFYV